MKSFTIKTCKKWMARLLVLALLAGLVAVPNYAQAKSSKKVKLNKTSVTLTVGKTTTLKLKNAPKGKKITWSSNKKKIATVSKKGKVTAKKAGKAKITAKLAKKKYTCTVTVKKKKGINSAKYTIKRINKSKTFKNGKMKKKANVYFDKPVLKGKSKAIKTINKSINQECNRFLNSKQVKKLYNYAKDGAKEKALVELGTYHYYAKSTVTYNNKGIISIKIKTLWYAGGIGQVGIYGLNYNLKTGEKLYLTDVCSGGASAIKESIISKMKEAEYEYSEGDIEIVDNYKTKKFRFYLKPNKKVIICFKPYELSLGASSCTIKIKGKYK